MAGPSTFVDAITSRLATSIGLNGTLPKRKHSGFDIEEFKSNINTRGVLPTNLFLVTIFAKPQIKTFMADEGLNEQSLTFFCMKTDLPGINLALESNIVKGIGPLEQFPHSAVFGNITLDFIGDAKGNIMSFFHNWLNYIVPFNEVVSNSDDFFKVEYKDTYTCTIEITVYNAQSDKVLIYKIYDAFPSTLSQISMSWGNAADMMTISTEFYYKTWSSERLRIDSITDQSNSLSTIQKLIKAGTIVQTVSSLRKPQSIADIINIVNNANLVTSGISGAF
jgi:hypothetical protein